MTAQRMREILDQLGWSGHHLADRRLRINRTTVQRMLTGEARIKPGLAAWLEKRAALDEACPLPDDWDAVPGA